jgi:hypothetical protein
MLTLASSAELIGAIIARNPLNCVMGRVELGNLRTILRKATIVKRMVVRSCQKRAR